MNHQELVRIVTSNQRWNPDLVTIIYPAHDYFEHYYGDCNICYDILEQPYSLTENPHIHVSHCPCCNKETELEVWKELHTITYHGKQVVVDGETLICTECGFRRHVNLGPDCSCSTIDEIENYCADGSLV